MPFAKKNDYLFVCHRQKKICVSVHYTFVIAVRSQQKNKTKKQKKKTHKKETRKHNRFDDHHNCVVFLKAINCSKKYLRFDLTP